LDGSIDPIEPSSHMHPGDSDFTAGKGDFADQGSITSRRLAAHFEWPFSRTFSMCG
jgi:hypothetical protein